MRIKRGVNAAKKRRKILKEAKGYFGAKSKLYRTAREQVMKSGQYAYIGRKQKKRDFRKLWITRINAACRENEISYSKFMNGLAKAGIEINRKMLSEMAINDAAAFTELVKLSKAALEGKTVKKVETKKSEPKKEVSTKKDVETKKEVKAEVKDYSKMTLAELKAVAKEQGVKGYSTMKKDEIIANLK